MNYYFLDRQWVLTSLQVLYVRIKYPIGFLVQDVISRSTIKEFPQDNILTS